MSVIIPARDAAPTLGRTLQSLREQVVDVDFEVVVVDDGSHDETSMIAESYAPFVRLVRNERSLGPGSARNRGAEIALAPVLAFTDADCFPTPKWLACGLESITSVDLVQGRVEPDPTVPRTPFDRTLSVDRDAGLYQTANLLVRRSYFNAVGGFRDWALEEPGRRRWSVDTRRSRATRTPIGEDTLFAWSARRLGARSTFAPDVLVHHEVVAGGIRDDLADRWHWTRDMAGLVRLVPELRKALFYRRVFFSGRTAHFDLALASIAAAGITRRKLWLIGAVPYIGELRREAARYRLGGAPPSGLRHVAAIAVGTPTVDAVTLAGLIAGSISWRSLVL